jgi:hypothetical protein
MFDDILSQWFKNTGQNGASGQGQDPYISNYRQQMANQYINNQPMNNAPTNPMSVGNYPLRQALYMQNMMNQGSTGFGSGFRDLNTPQAPAAPPQAPGMTPAQPGMQPGVNPYAYTVRGYDPASAQTAQPTQQTPVTGKITKDQLPPIRVFQNGNRLVAQYY